MKTVNYSWWDIEIAVKKIVKKYENKYVDLIFGINSGGILPAYLVAKGLFSEDNYQTIRPDKKIPESITNNTKSFILIIDDILDTGATKQKIMKQFKGRKNVHFETLFKAKKDTWLIFPWETNQDKINTRQHKL